MRRALNSRQHYKELMAVRFPKFANPDQQGTVHGPAELNSLVADLVRRWLGPADSPSPLRGATIIQHQ
jgi:hypothetical protein